MTEFDLPQGNKDKLVSAAGVAIEAVATPMRREITPFTTAEQAFELTAQALRAAGFTVFDDPDSIDPKLYPTYDTAKGDGAVGSTQLAGTYTSPVNGNRVNVGLAINGYDLPRGPFSAWLSVIAPDQDTPLNSGGNHDFSQAELIFNLSNDIALADFNVASGRARTWDPEYRARQAELSEMLDPIRGPQ